MSSLLRNFVSRLIGVVKCVETTGRNGGIQEAIPVGPLEGRTKSYRGHCAKFHLGTQDCVDLTPILAGGNMSHIEMRLQFHEFIHPAGR